MPVSRLSLPPAYVLPSQKFDFSATIAMIDDSVGAVMEALKRKDMLSNSVVVVMSDNGGAGEEYIIRPSLSSTPATGRFVERKALSKTLPL